MIMRISHLGFLYWGLEWYEFQNIILTHFGSFVSMTLILPSQHLISVTHDLMTMSDKKHDLLNFGLRFAACRLIRSKRPTN
jgi:hypothetical protein